MTSSVPRWTKAFPFPLWHIVLAAHLKIAMGPAPSHKPVHCFSDDPAGRAACFGPGTEAALAKMSPGQGCGCGSSSRPFLCEQVKGLSGQERLPGGAPGPRAHESLGEPLLSFLWFAVNNGADSHSLHLSPVRPPAACGTTAGRGETEGARQGGLESWQGGSTQRQLPPGQSGNRTFGKSCDHLKSVIAQSPKPSHPRPPQPTPVHPSGCGSPPGFASWPLLLR